MKEKKLRIGRLITILITVKTSLENRVAYIAVPIPIIASCEWSPWDWTWRVNGLDQFSTPIKGGYRGKRTVAEGIA